MSITAGKTDKGPAIEGPLIVGDPWQIISIAVGPVDLDLPEEAHHTMTKTSLLIQLTSGSSLVQ